MTAKLNIGGVYKDMTDCKVNIGGVWKPVTDIFNNIGGVWKTAYTSILQKTITIDSTKVDATLTDFPLTVYLNSSNYDFTKSKADGTDISFTDIGGMALKFERQEFSNVLGVAVFHVKVPSVSSSVNTSIYMKYGDLSAIDAQDKVNVWDSNYKTVLHIGASLLDSTSNGNNGTNFGTTVVDTALGKFRQFAYASLDRITLPIIKTLNQSTYLMVYKKYSNGKNHVMFDSEISGSYWPSVTLREESDKAIFRISYNTSLEYKVLSPSVMAINTTYALCGKYDRTNLKLFIDGTQVASVAGTAIPNDINNQLAIGSMQKSAPPYWQDTIDGEIGECRISVIARSDAWVKAELLGLKNDLATVTDA